jgi:aromatase
MAGHTSNEVVIEAPLDDVWRITNDVASWPDLFSEYAEANILRTQGDTVLFELVMHPDEHGTVWRWVSTRTADRANRRVDAHRVEPGPFEHMRIRWEYEELGPQRTLMRWEQEFAMRPTAPVDDGGMTERINTNTVVQMALIKSVIEAARPIPELVP